MNILFATSAAPDKSPFFTYEKRPPLGLGSLIALVRNEGHSVFFIDNYLKQENFIKDGFLQINRIDFIGIYANTICYRDTLRMLHEIENLRNKGLWKGEIIIGGPHTSVAFHTIPDFVDYVVQGEGERAILPIINGTAHERVIREERIKDLDSIPFQPWDIFNTLPYHYSCPWLDAKPVFTMNTSRGCPFSCTFCSVKSIWGTKYSFFSADRIISEIEYLVKQFGAKGIYFREDHFTLNTKRTIDFCENLIRKRLDIQWACETRVDNISAELIQLMSASGCKAFYLGVESGRQRILDMLHKNIKVEQIEETINWCKKDNIKTYCSLIVGLPGETFEDYLFTERWIKKIKPHSYGFNVFVGIPNSHLYQYILDNQIFEYIDDVGLVYLPGFDIKAKFFYGRDSMDLVNYEFKQRTDFDRKLMKEQYKKDFMKMLNICRRTISAQIPKVIKKKIKKIIKNAYYNFLNIL